MTGRVPVAAMVVVMCACGPAWGDTPVSGTYTTDTTWTLAGSPYVVVGQLKIRFSKTLTIEPGVTVKFNGFYRIETESGSSIVADGTPDQNIVFTSGLVSPAVGDWDSVFLFGSPGSSFSSCVFEYAQKGLHLITSSPAVTRCAFRNCQTGLQLVRSTSALTSCDITDCTFTGIGCSYEETSPVIHECNISNPGPSAWNVLLDSYFDPPVITIDATHCWWGTDDPPTIASKIWDNVDRPVQIWGVVNYDEFLSAPGVEPSSWGAIKALFNR